VSSFTSLQPIFCDVVFFWVVVPAFASMCLILFSCEGCVLFFLFCIVVPVLFWLLRLISDVCVAHSWLLSYFG